MPEIHHDEADSIDNQISSRYGLKYSLDASGRSFHLEVPMDLVKRIGGIKVIAQDLYPAIFDGRVVNLSTSFMYFVQLPLNTPIEKVQALVDEIERRNTH